MLKSAEIVTTLHVCSAMIFLVFEMQMKSLSVCIKLMFLTSDLLFFSEKKDTYSCHLRRVVVNVRFYSVAHF